MTFDHPLAAHLKGLFGTSWFNAMSIITCIFGILFLAWMVMIYHNNLYINVLQHSPVFVKVVEGHDLQ
jgi:DMSO reductase anchor subunit